MDIGLKNRALDFAHEHTKDYVSEMVRFEKANNLYNLYLEIGSIEFKNGYNQALLENDK